VGGYTKWARRGDDLHRACVEQSMVRSISDHSEEVLNIVHNHGDFYIEKDCFSAT
jgi:hypothetical protein